MQVKISPGGNHEHMSICESESGVQMARRCAPGRPKGGTITPAPQVAAEDAFSAHDAIDVVATRLDVGAEAVRESEALLSDAERHRASRFVFERDRDRFIVARARLREMLAARLGMAPESIELEYGPHGKPALARGHPGPDLRFNVSHSEDVAVYAFSLGREVGIDVEAVREIRDADEIAARFFSRRECEAFLSLDSCDRLLGFLNCWTRKEAFIKALGEGLNYPLDRFDVSLAPGEPIKIYRVADVAGDVCGWTLHDLGLKPGFVGAVVVGDKVSEQSEFPLREKLAHKIEAHSMARLSNQDQDIA